MGKIITGGNNQRRHIKMLSFEDTGKTYKIGELAKELDRSTLTIKKWESKGIIPEAKRDSRGWRYYTQEDVNEIKKMLEAKGYLINHPTG
ncbi:MerR family transcriptional regulator [Candidatus Poribacteria bacterium]|nr:MerR family transcriptional regulator [Candidatus Poribacteria bacterium]